MEVRAAVTPAVQVHAADVAQRQDRLLDPPGHSAEVGGMAGRHVRERVEVLAAGEPYRAGQAAADGRVQGPQVVVPERGGRAALADPARLPAGLAPPRRLRNHPLAGRPRHQRLLIWHGHGDSLPFIRRGCTLDPSTLWPRLARPKAAASQPMSRPGQPAGFTQQAGNGEIELLTIRRPVMPAASHLSYSHGASAEPLLGETIGDNLRRIAAAHAGARGAGRRADRHAVDLRAARRRQRPGRARPDRGGRRQGRPGRHLGAQLRRVGARSSTRTAKVGAILVNINPAYRSHELAYVLRQSGRQAAGQRRELQDQRLPRHGRARCARDLPGLRAGDLHRHRGLGRAAWRPGAAADPAIARRARGEPGVRRPDQHPVHQRDDRLPQGRDAVAPQHPQQRVLRRRGLPATPPPTASASRCRSTTASAW